MSEAEALLALLADVHEPAVPEAAFPWWWLLNALLGLAWMLLLARRGHRRRTAWRREAIAVLDALPRDDAATRLAGMAILLRRVVRGRVGESAASLDGDAWLELLDRRFDTHWFTRGDGRVFGEALYRRDASTGIDLDGLQAGLRTRLRHLPGGRSVELPLAATPGRPAGTGR